MALARGRSRGTGRCSAFHPVQDQYEKRSLQALNGVAFEFSEASKHQTAQRIFDPKRAQLAHFSFGRTLSVVIQRLDDNTQIGFSHLGRTIYPQLLIFDALNEGENFRALTKR